MPVLRSMTVLMFGFLITCPVLADDPLDCDNAMDQNTMTRCAGLDFEKADAELNKVWKQARTAAEAADAEYAGDMKGEAAALLKAQRGWIAYRDGQCELAGFEARGGSMEPMLVNGCLAEMTKARTRELQAIVDGPAQ
jgi:uncharacterized protein YecT (DUF1311 family)